MSPFSNKKKYFTTTSTFASGIRKVEEHTAWFADMFVLTAATKSEDVVRSYDAMGMILPNLKVFSTFKLYHILIFVFKFIFLFSFAKYVPICSSLSNIFCDFAQDVEDVEEETENTTNEKENTLFDSVCDVAFFVGVVVLMCSLPTLTPYALLKSYGVTRFIPILLKYTVWTNEDGRCIMSFGPLQVCYWSINRWGIGIWIDPSNMETPFTGCTEMFNNVYDLLSKNLFFNRIDNKEDTCEEPASIRGEISNSIPRSNSIFVQVISGQLFDRPEGLDNLPIINPNQHLITDADSGEARLPVGYQVVANTINHPIKDAFTHLKRGNCRLPSVLTRMERRQRKMSALRLNMLGNENFEEGGIFEGENQDFENESSDSPSEEQFSEYEVIEEDTCDFDDEKEDSDED